MYTSAGILTNLYRWKNWPNSVLQFDRKDIAPGKKAKISWKMSPGCFSNDIICNDWPHQVREICSTTFCVTFWDAQNHQTSVTHMQKDWLHTFHFYEPCKYVFVADVSCTWCSQSLCYNMAISQSMKSNYNDIIKMKTMTIRVSLLFVHR